MIKKHRKTVNGSYKLSEADQQKIIKLFIDGHNYDELGRIFKVNPKTIGDFLKRMGYKARYKGKLHPKDREQIVSHYKKENLNFKEFAKKYNVSANSMRNMLLNYGCEVKERAKYNINSDYFKKIDNQNKAYILGLLFADGSNYTPEYKIVLALKTEDGYIIEKIKEELESERPLNYKKPKIFTQNCKKYKSKGSLELYINNKKLSKQLLDLGMMRHKSFNIRFPENLKENLKSHFIRGYFDGDGHVTQNKVSLGFSGNKEFLKAIKNILESKLQVNENKVAKNGSIYCIRYSAKKDLIAIRDFLYKDANLFLNRKYELLQNIGQ